MDCIPLPLEKKSFRSPRYILVAWLTPAAFHSRIDMSIEKYSATAERYRKLVFPLAARDRIYSRRGQPTSAPCRIGKTRKIRAIDYKANNRLDVSRSS